MTVNIHAVNFEADSKLLDHVNKKILKLSNHHDRIIKVDVFLKLDNVIHNIKDKVSEMTATVPARTEKPKTVVKRKVVKPLLSPSK